MFKTDLKRIKKALEAAGHDEPKIIGEVWLSPYRCPCCGDMIIVEKMFPDGGKLRYGKCNGGSIMIRSFYRKYKKRDDEK